MSQNFTFEELTQAQTPNPQTPNPPTPNPQAPPVPPEPPTDPCEPEPCIPQEVEMNVEIQPVVTLCINKPTIRLKNNAKCICTPCKPPS